MKKIYLFFCMVTCLFSSLQIAAQCDNGRYYNKNFSSSVSTVQYGSAIQYDSIPLNLNVDIYQPSGDNFAHRPLMIFAFGGSFTSGARESPDLVYLCTAFAERGYVCASIDYRLGYYGPETDTVLFQAMIRGIQDMKAAVRFFYKDAQTADQYRIDTNQIFIGGVSAGAFIALNYAYFRTDTFSKTPPGFVAPSILSLGGLEGTSGNPGYSTNVKGVIDLCGGLADTVWLVPGVPILVGVHGTDDSTVACWWDSAYQVRNDKSSLFGGGDIKNRLDHINANQTVFTDSFYLFYGAGHCPFILPYPPTYDPVPWMDTTENIIRDFLYPKNIVCDSTTVPSGIYQLPPDLSIWVSPIPSDDVVTIASHYTEDLWLSVMTVDGKVLRHQILGANSSLVLPREEFDAGVFILQFSDKTDKTIYKTEKIVFY